jgi:hypothetical protein
MAAAVNSDQVQDFPFEPPSVELPKSRGFPCTYVGAD